MERCKVRSHVIHPTITKSHSDVRFCLRNNRLGRIVLISARPGLLTILVLLASNTKRPNLALSATALYEFSPQCNLSRTLLEEDT